MAALRLGPTIAVVVLAGLFVVASASADGDPASDVLPIADVYTPYPAPSNARDLSAAVRKVYASGHRIKVAVIATRRDLGSIPSLFGKSGGYAAFLGQEIAPFYSGPLLIVMPSGYGIYDAHHTTAPEKKVLARLKPGGKSATDLVSAAASAVQSLAAAKALDSPDTQPPTIYPSFATVEPGKSAKLSFHVLDNSEHASEVVTVYSGKQKLAVLHSQMGAATYETALSVNWNVPSNVPAKGLKFCVVGTDPSGNTTPTPACTPLAVKH
ncbi:MAG TPA: hypothetical protein VGL76_06180 [Gaiellaceae bacterium]|jgi:hypothetical protein